MALIVVLLLISMALGLCYAATRSQHTAHLIQRNSDRGSSARQAAITGATMALKKMHTSDWQGVGTTLTGWLGGDVSFEATYTTGDASLSTGDPDYEQYPYRVTLLSRGMAADPNDPQAVATHQIRLVVRLVPRALAAEPAEWDQMMSYTLYNSHDNTFWLNVPCRVEGPVRVKKTLELGELYYWPDDARDRYLADLNPMRLAGYPDWRPFDGPLDLPYNMQRSGLIGLLNVSMGVATNDVPMNVVQEWSHPGALSTYQLYPGGEIYSAQTVGQTLRNVTLEPDPITNPLGIFYRDGRLQLYENVTVRGMLITKPGAGKNVELHGINTQLLPNDLPALEGSSEPVQLPALVSGDNIVVDCDAQLSAAGVLAAKHRFDIRADDQGDMVVAIEGRVIARRVKIHGRRDWYQDATWWQDRLDEFLAQEGAEGGIPYFPEWLRVNYNLQPAPQLTIKPQPTSVRYHWHNADNPIYVPHAADDGLRWELLEWTENP